MTTIDRIELTPVSIPYRHPLHWAYGAMTSGDHVVVQLVLDDGTVGFAEGLPRMSIYGETQRSLIETIGEIIAPRLVGRDVWDPGLVADISAGIMANNVAKGATEQALWHARSRATGVPLHRLLGGEDGALPVAWLLSLLSFDEMIQDARSASDRGYQWLKIKGGTDPDFDIELYSAIKDALPSSRAYIDANQGYSWPDSRRVAATLQPLGLEFLEEPMEINDPMRARLWEDTGVGIIGDESVTTEADAYRQLATGSVQLASIKISRTGVGASRRIAGLFTAAGARFVVGTQGESALGSHLASEVAASLPRSSLLTTELSHAALFTGQVVQSDVFIQDGQLHLSKKLDGLRIDPDGVARFRVG